MATLLQALTFDLDGVLIDTEWAEFGSVQAAAAVFDIEVRPEQWAAVYGSADYDAWWQLDCFAGLLPGELARLRAKRKEAYEGILDQLTVSEGAAELIESAEHRGVPCGLTSNSPVEWVDRMLGRCGLSEAFDLVITPERGIAAKPSPAMYEHLCRTLSVTAERCVGLEDSPPGLTALRRARLRSIAVRSSRVAQLFPAAPADFTVSSLLDLSLDVVEELVRTGTAHRR